MSRHKRPSRVKKKESRRSTVTLAHARKVASVLMAHTQVKGIEVFGSVARNGKGHDLDIIVLVSETVARKYFADIIENADIMYRASASLLSCVFKWKFNSEGPLFSEFLGADFDDLLESTKELLPKNQYGLDVILLPIGWRRKKYIIKAFFGDENRLWPEIVREARRIA